MVLERRQQKGRKKGDRSSLVLERGQNKRKERIKKAYWCYSCKVSSKITSQPISQPFIEVS